MAIIHRHTDYALRALARLAQTGGMMSVTALAEAEDVPEDFLRKIMQALKRAGLVDSVQGPFGGYRLTRSPREITLLHVIVAMQGGVAVNACFEDPRICHNVKVCAFRQRLKVLQKELDSWLGGISLADVIEGMPQSKEVKA